MLKSRPTKGTSSSWEKEREREGREKLDQVKVHTFFVLVAHSTLQLCSDVVHFEKWFSFLGGFCVIECGDDFRVKLDNVLKGNGWRGKKNEEEAEKSSPGKEVTRTRIGRGGRERRRQLEGVGLHTNNEGTRTR